MKNRRTRLRSAVMLPLAAAVLSAACAGSRARRLPSSTAPPDSAAEMSRAYDLLKAGRAEDAASVMSKILRADPTNRRTRLELAYVDVGLKRWPDAIALLDSLIEESPSDMRLRMELGYARLALGDRAAAADEFAIVAPEPGEFQAQARAELAASSSETSVAQRAERTDAILNQGYEALRRGDKIAARALFEQALRGDPGRTIISKQLGYMSLADGDLIDAAREFEGAHHLAPLDDETELELGYIYDSLHDEAGALKSFRLALRSSDPAIRAASASALKNIQGKSDAFYADVYASPYDSSRFADKIAYFEASLGWKPDSSGPLSFYLGSRYTQDSLSHGGRAPAIYSDNYASIEPGLRYQPQGFNANLTAEWGLAFNLVPSGDHANATEFDGRVVLADYHYWEGPHRLFADAGGSAGFYSRYRDNGIGYLQLRAGDKAWDNRSGQLSLYVPVNVYKDVNKDFYNNAVEVGAGAELQPWTKVNLKLRAEYLRGTYMGITGRDANPYGAHYDDVRLTLIYSGHFTRHAPDAAPSQERPPGYLW